MSIAEFYIENGIDPTDPDHMDKFFSRYEDEPTYHTGVAIARIERDSVSRTAASSWPLNESELDYMGETRGWDKIYDIPSSKPPMASYKKDGIRLNFWLSTGTVGSYLDHPRQGKTQLFRREVSMSGASDIFSNPRQHTGKGYHTKNKHHSNGLGQQGRKRKAGGQGVYMRRCASCGSSKPNDQFSNNQRKRGASSKCKECV